MQDFLLTSLQADLEISVLHRVQKLVERNYVDGHPHHHLPAARDTNYTPGSSVFFIVDFVDFMKLPPFLIHRILRDRHIVVQNIPQEDFSWSLDTFSRFGSLAHRREIQGMLPVDSLPSPSPHLYTSCSWAMPWGLQEGLAQDWNPEPVA